MSHSDHSAVPNGHFIGLAFFYTETHGVREDLAKSLAISCVVTNCGDGLDFRAMGVIFSGLSETGGVKRG